MKGRGDKSSRNLRDSVEEIPNCLGSPWRRKELKWRVNNRLGFEGVWKTLFIPFNPRVGYVRLGSQMCPGQEPDLSDDFWLRSFQGSGRICPAKEADMSGHFGQKKIWKLYKIRLLKDLAYRPIVVHILVINGQVLKIKTYIWLESNKIIKHA
jgi:hypothetical protein